MDGYHKERKRLMKRFAVSENDAMRLLRTEMSRIRLDAQIAKYKEKDIKGKEDTHNLMKRISDDKVLDMVVMDKNGQKV